MRLNSNHVCNKFSQNYGCHFDSPFPRDSRPGFRWTMHFRTNENPSLVDVSIELDNGDRLKLDQFEHMVPQVIRAEWLTFDVNANLKFLIEDQVTAMSDIFLQMEAKEVQVTCILRGTGTIVTIPFNLLRIGWFRLMDGGWDGDPIFATSYGKSHAGLPVAYVVDMSPRRAGARRPNELDAMMITEAVPLVTSCVPNDFYRARICTKEQIVHVTNDLFDHNGTINDVDIDVGPTATLFRSVWESVRKHLDGNVRKFCVRDTDNRTPSGTSNQDRNHISVNAITFTVYLSSGSYHRLLHGHQKVYFTLTNAYKKAPASTRKRFGVWMARRTQMRHLEANEQMGVVEYAARELKRLATRKERPDTSGLAQLLTLTVYLYADWRLSYFFELPLIDTVRFYADGAKMVEWVTKLNIRNSFKRKDCEARGSFHCVEYVHSKRKRARDARIERGEDEAGVRREEQGSREQDERRAEPEVMDGVRRKNGRTERRPRRDDSRISTDRGKGKRVIGRDHGDRDRRYKRDERDGRRPQHRSRPVSPSESHRRHENHQLAEVQRPKLEKPSVWGIAADVGKQYLQDNGQDLLVGAGKMLARHAGIPIP